MTTLSINPLHIRPQLKRLFRRPKHVEIPKEASPELQDKLMNVQNSLDYMATNFGINFEFIKIPGSEHTFLRCSNKKSNKYENRYTLSKFLDNDDQFEITKKIYKAASFTINNK